MRCEEWPESALSCRCSRRREAARVAPEQTLVQGSPGCGFWLKTGGRGNPGWVVYRRTCCQRKALLALLAALLHAAQENCLAVCELGETML
jgi:hypothetical protein